MPPGDELETRLSLIQALKDEGDAGRRERAWRDFLQRYHPYLRACVAQLKVHPNEVEEATSVVLSRMVSAMSRFDEERHRGPGGFRAWLRAVARNAVLDWLRSCARQQDVARGGDSAQELLLQVPAEVSSLCDEVGSQLEKDTDMLQLAQEVVRRVRERCDAQVWQAFYLREVEGLETAEVARRLGIDNANNVSVYCLRVRRRLQEELARTAAGR